jgi:hypothetical protein
VAISSDTTKTITFSPQTVTVSGHVYDESGNLLPNQPVSLAQGPSGSQAVTTDSSGSYSILALPGTYEFGVGGGNNNTSMHLPQWYNIEVSYALTQSLSNLNLTVPAKRLDIHIQDPSGNPVSNVGVKATPVHASITNLSLNPLLPPARGSDHYDTTFFKTNVSGDVTLWLLPNKSYTLTAVPPAGGIYSQFLLNNMFIDADTSLAAIS